MVAATVGTLLAGVAASLRPQIPTLCAGLIEQMAREMPELAADKALEDLLSSSVIANVSLALDVFEKGLDPAGLEAPPAAVEYARRLAQRGVPISSLLRAYRLGQAGFQQQLIQGVSDITDSSPVVIDASLELSSVTFGYVDLVSEQVVVVYQAERDRWMRNRGAVRSARVMSVLVGGAPDLAEAEHALGYPLHPTHQGVVVWVDASSQDHERLTRLERVVSRLAEHYGSERAPLAVAPDDSTVWAWFPIAAGSDLKLTARPEIADDGVWAALGDPAAGVDGFRLTHRQAMQAQVVAMAADPGDRPRVTASRDAGLIALMVEDLDAVRAWVGDVLGPLAVDDEATARLRDTVRSFLSAGGSYTAAARELILHKNTVQYRIRKAEELRRRPLSDGRVDVEVALLAVRMLGAKVLRPVTGSR